MRQPLFITFTGIDDRTDLTRADKLASEYPIEWGILFSETNRDARYPCKQAISEILELSGSIAAHLCGRIARRAASYGVLPEDFPLEDVHRIQINGRHKPNQLGEFSNHHDIPTIGQVTNSFSNDLPHLQLYDKSGGRGNLIDYIPPLPGEVMVGIAGGLSAGVVGSVLERIEGDGDFWIDMEGRIRTDGWFDLDKVEAVCHAVYG